MRERERERKRERCATERKNGRKWREHFYKDDEGLETLNVKERATLLIKKRRRRRRRRRRKRAKVG